MWPLLLEASGMQQKGDENGAGKKSNKRTPGPRFSSAISAAAPRTPEILAERAGGGGGSPGAKWVFPSPRGAQPPSRSSRLKMLSSKNKGTDKKKICKRFHFLNNCAALSCKASRRPDYKGGHLRFWKDLCFPLKAYF